MFYLGQHMKITNGYSKNCIANVSNGKLYHVSRDVVEFMYKVMDTQRSQELTRDEREMLDVLIEEKILVTEREPKFHAVLSHKAEERVNFAWIEVTCRCNLKCIHCYEEALPESKDEMSLDDFKHVIDALVESGTERISIIGGEPLMLKDRLKQRLEYCKGKFKFIELFTNGTLLDQEMVSELQASGISRVALSLYSENPEEHDRITGVKGSYKRTLQGIEYLKNAGINYRIASVAMAGITCINKFRNNGLIRRQSALRLVGRAQINLLSRSQIRSKLITEKTFSRPLSANVLNNAGKRQHCFKTKIYIAHDLNVYPCVMERRRVHGSLKDSKMKDILKSSLFNLTKEQIDSCKECEFRDYCFDCRPDAMGRGFLEKPWNCTYKPREGRWEEPEVFIDQLIKEMGGCHV